MSEAMELTQKEFDQIGTYVREHLGTWIRDVSQPTAIVQIDPVYLERIVRVEEELKSQRELMKQGFEQMDRRFEQVDKRLEQVDKRFEQMDKRFEQVDKRFEETRADTNSRFEEMRSDMYTRFEAVDKRFEEMRSDTKDRFQEMRADMKTGFEAARSHTNVWMTVLTIVIALVSTAGTLITSMVVG